MSTIVNDEANCIQHRKMKQKQRKAQDRSRRRVESPAFGTIMLKMLHASHAKKNSAKTNAHEAVVV